MKCARCRMEIDSSYTAYLQDRSKVEGLCRACADQVEQEDLDKLTLECMDKLHHVVNGGSSNELAESLFRSIQRQHRYLQNQFFMALHKLFEKYGALSEKQYDERNEWAVGAANRWQKVSFDQK